MTAQTITEVDGTSCVPPADIGAIAASDQAKGPTRSRFHGQILDTDGHYYLEPEALGELLKGFKDPGGFVMSFLKRYVGSPADVEARKHNREKVWSTKGISALGSCDAKDRVEALDLMGMRSQLIFPNDYSREMRVDDDMARFICSRYNDVALDWAAQADPDRLRIVAQINTHDVDYATAEVERVIKRGAKAIVIPCAKPMGGVSPAHSKWDRFWSILQEAQVPFTIHLGGGGLTAIKEPDDPMLPDRGWSDSDTLRVPPAERVGGEEAVSPYFLLVAHIPAEVFLISAVMGGLFEKFPRLTFGIFEFGTGWIGPTLERMDGWAAFLAKVANKKYPLKPSDYVRRNVRVSPFFHEDFATTAERYNLKDIFCFMSDYPHMEGGKDPIGAYKKNADRLGPEFERAFFVDNARSLFPGLKAVAA